MSAPEYLDADAIAAELDVSVQTIRARFRDGSLPGRKVGHGWRTTRAALDAWIAGEATPDPTGTTAPAPPGMGIEDKEHPLP